MSFRARSVRCVALYVREDQPCSFPGRHVQSFGHVGDILPPPRPLAKQRRGCGDQSCSALGNASTSIYTLLPCQRGAQRRRGHTDPFGPHQRKLPPLITPIALALLALVLAPVPGLAQPCAPGYHGHYDDGDGDSDSSYGDVGLTRGFVCSPCPPGTAGEGATAPCVQCPADTYSGSAFSECLPCPDGEHSLPGSSTCNACRAGQYGVSVGACAPCSAGYWSADYAAACSECNAGTYSSSGAA